MNSYTCIILFSTLAVVSFACSSVSTSESSTTATTEATTTAAKGRKRRSVEGAQIQFFVNEKLNVKETSEVANVIVEKLPKNITTDAVLNVSTDNARTVVTVSTNEDVCTDALTNAKVIKEFARQTISLVTVECANGYLTSF